MATPFAEHYPALRRWVQGYGWIEVGQAPGSPALVRVLDEGGLIWESSPQDVNIDDALDAAEAAVRKWLREELAGR